MTPPPIAALRQLCLDRAIPAKLRDLTLQVAVDEQVTLLSRNDSAGPADAASAALMVLAGFLSPTSGTVSLAGRDVAGVPPHRRGVAVVHRGLGLFEQLTVAGNLGFAGASPHAVRAMLQLAGLEKRAEARPAALDPAARVRLAIARALARRSPLLLLDHPLDGLDPPARASVVAFVAAARARQEFAILHAAGDADAAFSTLGVARERLVVLAGGSVVQDDAPRAVYEAPVNPAVAALTGQLNLLSGAVVEADDDETRIRLAGGSMVAARAADVAVGDLCVVCVRPERVAIASSALAGGDDEIIVATVRDLAFGRDHWRVRLRMDTEAIDLTVTRPAGVPLGGLRPGARVGVAWQAQHATAYRRAELPGEAVAPAEPGDYRVLRFLTESNDSVQPPESQDCPR